MRAASLYVHVPFCRSRCRYCAFHSAPVGPDGPAPEVLARYLRALEAEAGALARLAGDAPPVPTVFFGGGTPSLLGPAGLASALGILRSRFRLAPDAEVTMEANPDSATPELLAAARALGVNRLSLGVQSLDDACLRSLGRAHDAAQAARAVARARRAGFDNLGLDLIFGLPGQALDQWRETLRRAVDLGPEHLSCYGLTIEPGTPLAGDAAALSRLPDEDAQAEMFLAGSEYLEAAGYAHYEISNFARPGRACRHNQGCWRGEDVLGLGPAAASTLGGARWVNPAGLSAWADLVESGRVGRHAREELTPAIRAREALMLALRTAEGLDLDAYAALHGVDLRASHAELLPQLSKAGLIDLRGTRLRLSRRGMLVSNSVIRALGFDDDASPGDG